MTAHAQLDTICKPNAHEFLIKKQMMTSPNSTDVLEVYCRKCGTVCFLSAQPDNSSVKLVRPS